MGIKEFKIRFDNSVKTFLPGETIKGRVLLHLDSNKKCRGMCFSRFILVKQFCDL